MTPPFTRWGEWATSQRTLWLVVSLLAVTIRQVGAQVVLDGKFGSPGPLTGPNYQIDAAVGAMRGNNLFHSFSQFDLKAGDVATFSGPANIQNILSRVTGGTRSSIDGTIRSGIPGANFFLINPSGVVFGPNAAVDVSGAFAASTANYLKLESGARFEAALDADDSLLSTGPVAAFGFLEGARGAMEVRGKLKAGDDTSLSLVGSSVVVGDGAQLEAVRGQISVKGVTTPGEVPFLPSMPTTAVRSPGVNAAPPLAAPEQPASVVIRGGRLVLENAQVTAVRPGGDIHAALSDSVEVIQGSQIRTLSAGVTKGGNVRIETQSLLVDGQDGPAPTRIAADTFSQSAMGAGGDIVIQTDSVELRRGAEISVSTFGVAPAGQLEITASSLRLTGSDAVRFPTQLSANAAPVIGGGGGAGGGIRLQAGNIELSNGAGILAYSVGDGDAGTIHITSGSLTLRNGGITTSTATSGNGGEIHIQSDRLTLDGPYSSITAVATGLSTFVPAGRGGLIELSVGSLQLLNDAGISATTYGDGAGGDIRIQAQSILLENAQFQFGAIPGITAASKPPFFGEGVGGKGGDIEISAGSLTLNRGMLISATTSTAGDGGSVDIRAGRVILDSGSSIQSASLDQGRAGTLSVEALQNIWLNADSAISTSAPLSSGGDIQVRAGGEVRLLDSQITAQAGPGGGGSIELLGPSLAYLLRGTLTAQAVGDGGNLTLTPTYLVLNEGGLISKSSSANGGNINLLSQYFFQSESTIDASAPFGIPGTVTVAAPDVDLSGELVGLPGNLLGLDTQLRPDCGVRLMGNVSSFIVLGRGGLPLQPGGFIPSGLLPQPHENQ